MGGPKPLYALQVLQPDDTVRYTFGKGQTDGAVADNIMAKNVLTQNVGTFSFTVPTKKNGSSYFFNDIAVFDKVKVWFSFQSINVSAHTPNFAGRIYQITGPLKTPTGYMRIIKGRGLGEVLQRRLKSMKTWSDTIPNIVTELATALGLEGDGSKRDSTPADTIDFTVEIDTHETYASLLQKLSDYWISADVQCKKDFHVDVPGDLVWKARPFRTTGVETLTIGKNVLGCSVFRNLDVVRNKIYVYGVAERAHPADHDSWSEDLTKPNNQLDHTEGTWVASDVEATISIDDVEYIKGLKSIKVSGAGKHKGAIFTFNTGYKPNANYFPSFNAQVRTSSAIDVAFARLTDDSGDNNTVDKWFKIKAGSWNFITAPCGRKHSEIWTHDIANPSAFNWSAIKKLEIHSSFVATDEDLNVDNVFFNNRRFYALAEDATSPNYPAERAYTDDELRSNSECESRAKALLYQLKDVPIRLDLEVEGNTNILIGDQIPMAISAEKIDDENFDVVTVTQFFQNNGLRTFPTLVNSSNLRYVPPRTRDEILVDRFRKQHDVNRGAYRVK